MRVGVCARTSVSPGGRQLSGHRMPAARMSEVEGPRRLADPPERPGSSANHGQPCSGFRRRFDLGVPQVLCPGNPAVTGCHTGCFVWVWRLPGEVGSGQRDLVLVQPGCTLQGEVASGSLCCKHSWKRSLTLCTFLPLA